MKPGGRRRAAPGLPAADHDSRVADPDLGVEAAAGAGRAEKLLGAEGALHELDQLDRGSNGEVRRHAANATARGRLDRGRGHRGPPRQIRPEPCLERRAGEIAEVSSDLDKLGELGVAGGQGGARVRERALQRLCQPVGPSLVTHGRPSSGLSAIRARETAAASRRLRCARALPRSREDSAARRSGPARRAAGRGAGERPDRRAPLGGRRQPGRQRRRNPAPAPRARAPGAASGRRRRCARSGGARPRTARRAIRSGRGWRAPDGTPRRSDPRPRRGCRCTRRAPIYFWTSTFTLALPDFAKSSSSAARRVTSMTAGSFTVTTTLLPFSTLVTFTLVPNGSFLWAAVSPFLSKTSPFAVFLPWNLSP